MTLVSFIYLPYSLVYQVACSTSQVIVFVSLVTSVTSVALETMSRWEMTIRQWAVLKVLRTDETLILSVYKIQTH